MSEKTRKEPVPNPRPEPKPNHDSPGRGSPSPNRYPERVEPSQPWPRPTSPDPGSD